MTKALITIGYGGNPGPIQACICDMRCNKAWGVNGRRHAGELSQLSDDDDDIVYTCDAESGVAPSDPGTYEGGHAKPLTPVNHNKWCLRECERSNVIDVGERMTLKDLTKPFYNMPSKNGVENGQIDLRFDLTPNIKPDVAIIDFIFK